MKAAVVQITSGKNINENLVRMEHWLGKASRAGAKWVVLPELAYQYAEHSVWVEDLPRYESLLRIFSGWAKQYEIFLVPGSIREPVAEAKGHAYNTALVYSPEGQELTRYRKIFLFRATLPDRVYDESIEISAGSELAVAAGGEFQVGLAICYDIRFPELFRALKRRGAGVIALPAAFTVPTGRAHWDVLTRARAIENQVFLLASGQVGIMGTGAEAYGHSRIVSPWGEVLAEVPGSEEGFALADLDASAFVAARSKVDCWGSRRDDLFLP